MACVEKKLILVIFEHDWEKIAVLSPGKHNLLQAERGGALPLIPYSFPLPQISLRGSFTCCVTLVVSKHNVNVYGFGS